MHGGVGEWVEDFYRDSYSGLPTDGSANTVQMTEDNFRVIRGRSYFPRFKDAFERKVPVYDARSSARAFVPENGALFQLHVGFRIVARSKTR